MYQLIRKDGAFHFIRDPSEPEDQRLVKSTLYPPWTNVGWGMPPPAEKEVWRRFMDSGDLCHQKLNEKIRNSWQRCRQLEVDPVSGKCNDFQDEKSLLSQNERLLRTAEPIIRTLHYCLRGSSFVIVLTDESGYILRTCGDLEALRQADKLLFGPGANWGEASVGTNAIGTAITIGKPIQVTSVEHYCESHQAWTCSAAPIRHHEAGIIGYIDISGPRERANSHQLGLIVAAAGAIEDRLCLESSKDSLYRIGKYLEAVLNSVREGVIATDPDGVVTGVNKVAAKTLQLLPSEIVGRNLAALARPGGGLEAFFRTGRQYTLEPLFFETPRGPVGCTASANPIIDEQGLKRGAVLTFSSLEKTVVPFSKPSGFPARYTFGDIVGESRAMRQTVEQAKRVAQSPSNILILGESGTGKELVAQAIHNAGDYRRGPFVSINCGAVSRELIQSELFGYDHGAFTGARQGGSAGKFQMANGGSLFLDEIGEMPFEMQINLLRVLEEKAVVPVGGRKSIPVDARIIAATNKSLFEEVSRGSFREDLYYRLNVISIALPPLRTRKEDIALLTEHHLKRISRRMGKEIREIAPEVFAAFRKHPWPGNVRELVNALEHAVNFVKGSTLRVEHLPEYLREKDAGEGSIPDDEIMSLSSIEKRAIERTLRHFDGNVTRAAKALGIGRNTLYDKMRKYGIGGIGS